MLSFIFMSIAIAQTIAPTIGGYLNHYFDWRSIFYFSFVLNLGIALLMFRQLQETSVTLDKTPFSFRALALQYLSVLKGRAYIGAMH